MNNNTAINKLMLLPDTLPEDDLFEDKTHKEIADSIYDLVQNADSAITIGLEGPWGSGKSTVISFLKRRIDDFPDQLLINFDAWAHEGDPLRRIFLETIIDAIEKDKSAGRGEAFFSSIRQEVSNKIQNIKRQTNRTISLLGLSISVALFLTPFGGALFSKVDLNRLSCCSGEPYEEFLLSTFCLLAPLFVLVFNFFKLGMQGKPIKELQSWSFINNIDSEQIVNEFSSESERSSIEFEKYFNRVIEIAFHSLGIKRIVLVIDNLDRIDRSDALKIWSTLQTFVQQREGKNKTWINNLWVIVPYDPSGLSKVWEAEESGESYRKNVSKSFFDKCFQLRIDVPRLVNTDWETYARKLMTYQNYQDADQKIIIEILRCCNREALRIPTPREIKKYLNQVVFLRNTREDINLACIAYYVFKRELEDLSVDQIREKLISGKLLNSGDRNLLHGNIEKELASLIFGIEPDRAYQILLTPEIEKFISSKNEGGFKELVDQHGEAFWSTLDIFATNEFDKLDFHKQLNFVSLVYTDLNIEVANNLSSIIKIISGLKLLTPAIWSEQECYLGLIELCCNKYDFISKLCTHFKESLEFEIKNGTIVDQNIISCLDSCYNYLENKGVPIEPNQLDFNTLEIFQEWAKACLDTKVSRWFIPSDDIVSKLATGIKEGSQFNKTLVNAFDYLWNSQCQFEWEKLYESCSSYISQGAHNINNFSPEIFLVLSQSIFYGKIDVQRVANLLDSGQIFHKMGIFSPTEEIIFNLSMISAYGYRSELQDRQLRGVVDGHDIMSKIRNFWNTVECKNVSKVVEFLRSAQCYDVLWDLVSDKKNKLAGEIVKVMLNNSPQDLFTEGNTLKKVHSYTEMVRTEEDSLSRIAGLVEKAIEFSSLETEIVEMENLDLDSHTYELLMILEKSTTFELSSKIEDLLKVIDKDRWKTALIANRNLLRLALVLKVRVPDFELDYKFMDALVEYSNLVDGIQQDTSWDQSEWSRVCEIMGEGLYPSFRERITNYLIEHFYEINIDAFNLNYNVYDFSLLEKDYCRKHFENAIEKVLRNSDYLRIEKLLIILNDDKFNLNLGGNVLIEQLIISLLERSDEIQKQTIHALVDRMQIVISNQNTHKVNE